MRNHLCIVTGANRGIGKGITEELVQRGYNVLMVCRNTQQGEEVKEEILNKKPNTSVEVLKGNLSSLRTVKELAVEIIKKYGNSNIIIHNAGIWPSKLELNEDGLESAFMVNHIAPLYLNHLLLQKLKENAPSRIILVNAGLYTRGQFISHMTPYGKDFSKLRTYMNSKFCSILYMRKVAPLINDLGITINAVHPGAIRTGLGDFKGVTGKFLRFFQQFLRSIEAGAKGPVNLAINPNINTNGQYYDGLNEKPFVERALDEELVNLLWNTSLRLCNIENYLSF
jgi:NAD(P)-dependent dehydrogenase (short-subunit alcohol dehydrogenase family)